MKNYVLVVTWSDGTATKLGETSELEKLQRVAVSLQKSYGNRNKVEILEGI